MTTCSSGNCDCFIDKFKCPCSCKKNYGDEDLRRIWRVGISADYYPFEDVDENGQFIGFDIDLISEIARRLNFKIEFVDMSFDSLISALSIGYIDVVCSGITETEERSQIVDFTMPYFSSYQVLLYRDIDPIDSFGSLTQLDNRIVGVQKDTTQQDLMEEIRDNPNKIEFPTDMAIHKEESINDLVTLLKNQSNVSAYTTNEATVIVGPVSAISMIDYVARHFEESGVLSSTSSAFLDSEESCSIAIAKGNPLLKHLMIILNDLINSGYVDNLRDIWGLD